LGWDAQGVDISQDAVGFCRSRGLDCRQAPAGALPFADGSFDVLTAWHVLEHMADAARALAEWRRVLRPGGLLILETPDASSAKVRRRGIRYRRFWTPDHVYVFSPRNLLPLMEEADFDVLRPPWLGRPHRLSIGMAFYAVAYQCLKGLMRLAGVAKTFQLFCRRREGTLGEGLPSREALSLKKAA
jgi:SAM-dependent methyltransferase